MYAGPGPERITGWDRVALIGDASHPLHGAYSLVHTSENPANLCHLRCIWFGRDFWNGGRLDTRTSH